MAGIDQPLGDITESLTEQSLVSEDDTDLDVTADVPNDGAPSQPVTEYHQSTPKPLMPYLIPPNLPPKMKALKGQIATAMVTQGTNETPQDTAYRTSLTYVTNPQFIQDWEIAQGYARFNQQAYNMTY